MKLILRFPYGKPLKENEKEKLIADIVSSFGKVGDSSAQVEDSYYEIKHAMPEVVTWVLVISTLLSNIATVALAIREFLKKRSDVKELRISTRSIDIIIKGNMSDEEIRKVIAEGRKLVKGKKST